MSTSIQKKPFTANKDSGFEWFEGMKEEMLQEAAK